mmetsp:Transcript_124924/g.266624  ORF Transcript_124924/g.266624 Transcript_124924/m.266624 type:complete len:274 (+) Transcript_124924:2722-3543(+)
MDLLHLLRQLSLEAGSGGLQRRGLGLRLRRLSLACSPGRAQLFHGLPHVLLALPRKLELAAQQLLVALVRSLQVALHLLVEVALLRHPPLQLHHNLPMRGLLSQEASVALLQSGHLRSLQPHLHLELGLVPADLAEGGLEILGGGLLSSSALLRARRLLLQAQDLGSALLKLCFRLLHAGLQIVLAPQLEVELARDLRKLMAGLELRGAHLSELDLQTLGALGELLAYRLELLAQHSVAGRHDRRSRRSRRHRGGGGGLALPLRPKRLVALLG